MHPQALYKMHSNDHNFIAKVDSGASLNCISKSLWNRIKVNSKLAKPNDVLTGAGGSKPSLLGFADDYMLDRKVHIHRRVCSY